MVALHGIRIADSCRCMANVVMGVQKASRERARPFEEVMDELKKEIGVKEDVDMTEEHLQELVKRYKKLIKDRTGKQFPVEPMKQLEGAIAAVFGSWMNERAILYRQ